MMAAQMAHGWMLDRLLDGFAHAPAIAISDITMDSRAVIPGGVFLALSGINAHGIAFAPEALQRGAAAVITDLAENDERLRGIAARVPVVCCPDAENLASQLSVRFFGDPSAALETFAVTGTNGKTSIAWLIANALIAVGKPTAITGTLGFGRPDQLQAQPLTTPDAVTLQRQAREFCADGCQAMVFEASSHALDQGRLADIDVDIAVFSNLTRDHLDYHADMDAYFEAKAQLLAGDLHARIIGCDDAFGEKLWRQYATAAWQVRTLAPVEGASRFVGVTATSRTASGLSINMTTHLGDAHIESALVGDFNVQNLALALAALLAAGVPIERAASALSDVAATPGRMQRVGSDGPRVYVDFAHTPSALAAALYTLRHHTEGDVWCVFGCGGDRDRGKRPMMAKAAETADHVIVTSDNPRHEYAQSIIDDIVSGATRALEVEVDRATAIAAAIARANDNDTVLIAGKGHEQYQLIGDERLPFDDVAVAAAVLRQRGDRTC